jgi:hypothetical protein
MVSANVLVMQMTRCGAACPWPTGSGLLPSRRELARFPPWMFAALHKAAARLDTSGPRMGETPLSFGASSGKLQVWNPTRAAGPSAV